MLLELGVVAVSLPGSGQAQANARTEGAGPMETTHGGSVTPTPNTHRAGGGGAEGAGNPDASLGRPGGAPG